MNVVLRDTDGHIVRQFDLCYLRIKLVVQCDGRSHVKIMERWKKDIERREEVETDGYMMVVITSQAVLHEPEQPLRRIRRQLVLRGWGDVPAIDDRWREHFAA